MNLWKALRTLAKTRPPLIMLVICLFSIAVTLIILVIILHRNDKFPNVQANERWQSFIKQFEDAQFCIDLSNSTDNSRRVNSFTSVSSLYQSVVFNVKTDLSASLYKSLQMMEHQNSIFTFIGNLNLTGLEPPCESTSSKHNSSVLLTLVFPPVRNSLQLHSCMTVTGHYSIFSQGEIRTESKECSNTNASTNAINTGKLLQYNPSQNRNLNSSISKPCGQEQMIQFSYDGNPSGKFSFLNIRERLTIASNLLYGVYFLLTIMLIVLLLSVLCDRHLMHTEHHLLLNKEPMPL